MTDPIPAEPLSRRTLGGLAAAGLSLPVLSACGGGDDSSENTSSGPILTSDIEVGGGAVYADREVVVTQPTEGEFKAFDATCTHQGCQVGDVSDGTIHCPCHNSRFSIEDGSLGAPASVGSASGSGASHTSPTPSPSLSF